MLSECINECHQLSEQRCVPEYVCKGFLINLTPENVTLCLGHLLEARPFWKKLHVFQLWIDNLKMEPCLTPQHWCSVLPHWPLLLWTDSIYISILWGFLKTGSQSPEKVIKRETRRDNVGVYLSLEDHKATGWGNRRVWGKREAGRGLAQWQQWPNDSEVNPW